MRTGGRTGMLAMMRQIIDRPARSRWYVFAVGFFVAIKLTAAFVHRVAIGAWHPPQKYEM